MKIKLSRKQWEQIGKTANWELPENYEEIRNQRLYDAAIRGIPNGVPNGQVNSKESKKPYWSPIETISNPSTGKMHRCKVCWSDTPAGAKDNGFVSISEKIVHADDCPHKLL